MLEPAAIKSIFIWTEVKLQTLTEGVPLGSYGNLTINKVFLKWHFHRFVYEIRVKGNDGKLYNVMLVSI